MLQSLSIFSVLIYLNINKKKFYVPPTDKDPRFFVRPKNITVRTIFLKTVYLIIHSLYTYLNICPKCIYM